MTTDNNEPKEIFIAKGSPIFGANSYSKDWFLAPNSSEGIQWTAYFKYIHHKEHEALQNLLNDYRENTFKRDATINELIRDKKALQRQVEALTKPSFEFWAIIDSRKIDEAHYGIGIINGLDSSAIDALIDEVDTYLAANIEDFPDNSTITFIAKNVYHEQGQQTFPETCAWDFPPHWRFDVEIKNVAALQ